MIDSIAKTLAETRKSTEDVDGLHNLSESLFGSLQTKLIKHVSQPEFKSCRAPSSHLSVKAITCTHLSEYLFS